MKNQKEITIQKNLRFLRTQHNYTLEEAAEKIGVTRQAIAKWETGDSMPDLINTMALANLYEVTVDDLMSFDEEASATKIPPKGKHMFGVVKVQERGQIVIPKEARDIFNIKKGDNLVLLGDEDPESFGMALIPADLFLGFSERMKEELEGRRKQDGNHS
ncbi:helix-turn-helix domain-containing protein [Enterococcus sp. 669A]|uniref:Helix-turn-helix domain-containing protein n=1 Tax=Candidatus Enterococcus moelleringii TaxID=2815325 RepID=A0ABS3L8B5_9ENTE|nr:helix-turn-helix domain-containing protein [Enterococcus sp. 669A]MBO1305852.1 helix-turn-helix domain-containing protein [Enterococcus sp. 669A]